MPVVWRIHFTFKIDNKLRKHTQPTTMYFPQLIQLWLLYWTLWLQQFSKVMQQKKWVYFHLRSSKKKKMIPLLQSKRILFFNVPLLLIGQNFLQNDTQNLCVLRPLRICTDFLLESIRPPVAAPESWSGDLRAALLTPRVAYEWRKPFGSFIPWFIFCECIVRNVTMASF